jgi:predicted O-methyltransferase YrrM
MVIFPLRYPGKTNSFARGTLALQDELNYNDRRIPLIDAWTLFPGIETTDVSIGRLLPDEGSSISFREMIVLCSIVRVEHAHTIFEIGTSMGVTAFNLALNLPEGGTLFTVDLPFVQPGAASVETTHEVSISDRKMIFSDRRARRFVGSPIESRVSPLYGDSATFDFTRYKGQCDIVFVDGAHSLAYVAQDTETAFELARPGGLVLWHDYNDGHFWPDVQRHLVKVAQQHRIHRIRGTMIAVARTALN